MLGLQIVTVGQRASDVAREWFAADRYNDYVRLHGLGVELAEALAEYVHKRIRAELGFAHQDARERHELLKQGYRGSRYSFGYPACPNLADQRQLLALLDASRIGVELSDEDQLWPEQSTSAIVLHHPQARYASTREPDHGLPHVDPDLISLSLSGRAEAGLAHLPPPWRDLAEAYQLLGSQEQFAVSATWSIRSRTGWIICSTKSSLVT